MELKDILSISGKPGLHKYISQGRNGIIVEAFADKKRSVVSATTKVSALEDIAIYTEIEEVPLRQVLKTIFEKEDGKEAISHKVDNNDLKSYFEEILPDYDKDRVYVSDIKKVVQWYNLLIAHEVLNLEMLEEKEEETEAEADDSRAKEADDKGDK